MARRSVSILSVLEIEALRRGLHACAAFSEHLMCVAVPCLLLGCGGACRATRDGACHRGTAFLGSVWEAGLMCIWFSLEVLSTFIQILGTFSFKLTEDNDLRLFKNK